MTVVYKIPELYDDNLETLRQVLQSLEGLTTISGLFACEIRVKVDAVEAWAVIGWGEAGEPCVLRFEDDEAVPPVQGAFLPPPTPYVYTINQATGSSEGFT